MKFTRVQCEILRQSIGVFEECHLKPISRNKTVMNIRFLLNEQVKHCLIQLNFVKKANGWKPFLYNITFNPCDFLLHPQKYPFVYYFYLSTRRFTDVNHTCPYEVFPHMPEFQLFLYL